MPRKITNPVAAKNLIARLTTINRIFSELSQEYYDAADDSRFTERIRAGELHSRFAIEDVETSFQIPTVRPRSPRLEVVK